MLFKRILTVLIGAPIVVATILYPEPLVFKALVFICLIPALSEFFSICGFQGLWRWFGMGVGLAHFAYLLFCPSWSEWLYGWQSFLVVFIFSVHCFFFKGDLKGVVSHIAIIILGLQYLALGVFVGRLRELPDGLFWVLVLLAMTWLNDTFAYFIGHRFGLRKLASLISPGKTMAGFWGGFLGSSVGFLIFWHFLPNPLNLVQGIFIVFLVGLAAPLGDLSESLIKRSFGVKDSGNLIPGHGGMLDRIDALLFSAPVVYFFVRLVS